MTAMALSLEAAKKQYNISDQIRSDQISTLHENNERNNLRTIKVVTRHITTITENVFVDKIPALTPNKIK